MRRKQSEDEVLPLERASPEGVPAGVADAFFHGLDDVEQNRTVSVASAVAEGRHRIAEYRVEKQKRTVDDAARQQRT